MAEFVRLKRVPGSSLDIAKKFVVVEKTNEAIGQGGYICDVKLPSGEVMEGCYFSISINYESNEMEAFLLLELVSDKKLKDLLFCFNNFD